MCGIVAYVGHRPARDVVVDALRRMEYRGYDSAGIALVEAAGSEWKVLKQDAADSNGLPYPPKLREQSAAATPQAEASASADNKE